MWLGFAKTDLMGINTEIHFLSVDESHTHVLSKDTKHLTFVLRKKCAMKIEKKKKMMGASYKVTWEMRAR